MESSGTMELNRLGGTAFQGGKCRKMGIFTEVRNKRSAGLGYCIERGLQNECR